MHTLQDKRGKDLFENVTWRKTSCYKESWKLFVEAMLCHAFDNPFRYVMKEGHLLDIFIYLISFFLASAQRLGVKHLRNLTLFVSADLTIVTVFYMFAVERPGFTTLPFPPYKPVSSLYHTCNPFWLAVTLSIHRPLMKASA